MDNNLYDLISAEIAQDGPMTVARFMELALYHPELGYYSVAEREVGRQGDFYTSISVGPLFAQMLGYKFAAWLGGIGFAETVEIVEAGAHNADLALDLLSYFQSFYPLLFERLQYFIIEPLSSRVDRQQEKLRTFGQRVKWYRSLEDLPKRIHGLVISNELLDAMPVHQMRWNPNLGEWVEWGVGVSGDTLVWQPLGSVRNPRLQDYLPELPDELKRLMPDGFTMECSPAACRWWSTAADALNQGYLFTVDYGFEELDFLQPHRSEGTLRSYSRHQMIPNVLQEPGWRDITAHVNFSHIRRAGVQAGLKDVVYQAQSQFLSTILREMIQNKNQSVSWNSETAKHFQTLTHPEHLGRAFKVLVQRKGLSTP